MSQEVFARRLKELRDSEGLGTRQLALRLGVTHGCISHYENRTKNWPLG